MAISKKILASMMVVGLLALAVGWGTSSYFSSTKESIDNTFTAGILSMGSVTRSFSCPSGWVPGDSFTGTWDLTNTGTMDIKYLGIDIHNYRHGSADLADVIEVTEFKEWIPGYGWIDDLGAGQLYQTLVGDGVSPLTLKELMQSYIVGTAEPFSSGGVVDEFGNRVNHLTDCITGSGYDITPGPAIVVGGTYELKLTFKFMTTADNSYQGAWATIDIAFMGMQDISQAP